MFLSWSEQYWFSYEGKAGKLTRAKSVSWCGRCKIHRFVAAPKQALPLASIKDIIWFKDEGWAGAGPVSGPDGHLPV